jgi:hypothetical protein
MLKIVGCSGIAARSEYFYRPCSVSPTPAGIPAQSLSTPVCQSCRGLIPAHPKIGVRLYPTWSSPRPNTRRSGRFQGGMKTRLSTHGRNNERAVTTHMTYGRTGRQRDLGANLAGALMAPPQLRRCSLATQKQQRRRCDHPSRSASRAEIWGRDLVLFDALDIILSRSPRILEILQILLLLQLAVSP